MQEEVVIDTPRSTDLGFRDDGVDYDDYKCYMRVLSAENIPANQTSWSLIIDSARPLINEFNGVLQNWLFSPGTYLPLPSSYRELTPPSNGWHSFELISFSNFLPADGNDFTLNTEVKCYLQQSDGTEKLATTTYHSFIWNEGEDDGDYIPIFRKEFSCVYLTQEDPPVRD